MRRFFSFLLSQRKSGYSMAELVTTAAILGVVSTVGVKSYQAQTNRARTAEAKQSLSFVYTSEQSFRESWEKYHENLVVIGAVPSGRYHYDVGFDSAAHLDTSIQDYPETRLLSQTHCTSFYQICNGACNKQIVGALGSSFSAYGSSSGNCEVVGSAYLSGAGKYSNPAGKADAGSFKALAVGQLRNRDVWSIDEGKTLEHVEDGTE